MMLSKEILSDTADLYGISVCGILSSSRQRKYTDARAVVCYLLHNNGLMSCTEIAGMIHRTHPSVLYLEKKAKEWVGQPILNKRAVCAIKELQKRYSI